VIQLTDQLRVEPDQKTVRGFFSGITSVEVKSSGLAVSTRNKRYDIPLGNWIMKDQRAGIFIMPDVTFKMNYQVVND
jgi:hypothetical protein